MADDWFGGNYRWVRPGSGLLGVTGTGNSLLMFLFSVRLLSVQGSVRFTVGSHTSKDDLIWRDFCFRFIGCRFKVRFGLLSGNLGPWSPLVHEDSVLIKGHGVASAEASPSSLRRARYKFDPRKVHQSA